MLHKFLYPIALPTNSNDPSGTFDEGSVYYDSSLKTIKQYSQDSWQFLPNFSSLLGVPAPLLATGLSVCPFSVNATARTTLAMTNNTSYWIPFTVNRNTTVSAMSINVSTAGGTSVDVGIYGSNPNNLYPNTLLRSVTLTTGTAGLRTGTLSTAITLTPGIYWIALASNGAPTLTALNLSSLLTLAFSGVNAVTHYRHTGTTLPSTAPTSGYTAGTSVFPLVLLTISF